MNRRGEQSANGPYRIPPVLTTLGTMSSIIGGPGWWLASDGRWYPPETRPDYGQLTPEMSPTAQEGSTEPGTSMVQATSGPPSEPIEMIAPGPIPPAFSQTPGPQ